MAIGHFFDGKATLVVGTHTHVPTNDARILKDGTAYLDRCWNVWGLQFSNWNG